MEAAAAAAGDHRDVDIGEPAVAAADGSWYKERKKKTKRRKWDTGVRS